MDRSQNLIKSEKTRRMHTWSVNRLAQPMNWGCLNPRFYMYTAKLPLPVLPTQVKKNSQEMCPKPKILRRRECTYQKRLKTPKSRDKNKKRKSRKLPGQF